MSETDLAEVWARSLEELATMQIEPHQRAWLKLTRPLGLVENTALIATPNEFVKEQLETRLRALITHALSRELGRSIQLAVTVDPTAITAAAVVPAALPRPIPGPARQAPGQDGHGGMPGRSAARWTAPEWPDPTGRRPAGSTAVPWTAPRAWARPACRERRSRGPGRRGGHPGRPGIRAWPRPPGQAAGYRGAALPGEASGPFDALAGRPQHAAGPPRCPARPGPPRPGSIPSTRSRPS